MFNKIKNEIKAIKWANRKLILTDMKVILSCSVVFMAVIGVIEWLGKMVLSLIV